MHESVNGSLRAKDVRGTSRNSPHVTHQMHIRTYEIILISSVGLQIRALLYFLMSSIIYTYRALKVCSARRPQEKGRPKGGKSLANGRFRLMCIMLFWASCIPTCTAQACTRIGSQHVVRRAEGRRHPRVPQTILLHPRSVYWRFGFSQPGRTDNPLRAQQPDQMVESVDVSRPTGSKRKVAHCGVYSYLTSGTMVVVATALESKSERLNSWGNQSQLCSRLTTRATFQTHRGNNSRMQ
jgi:hypothetical protein